MKHDRYVEAPSGVKGDTAYRCLDCDILLYNRRDHEDRSHAESLSSGERDRQQPWHPASRGWVG